MPELLKIKCSIKKKLGDRLTPVEAFYRLRDYAVDPILMESSDYHSKEGSLSFLCIDPMAEFRIESGHASIKLYGRNIEKVKLSPGIDVKELFNSWKKSFKFDGSNPVLSKYNGFFGYTGFEAVSFLDDIPLADRKKNIPDMIYRLYRFVLVFDHFRQNLFLIENTPEEQEPSLKKIEQQLHVPANSQFEFSVSSNRKSNLTDEEFLDLVEKGKKHCKRGDVFQIVMSRSFSRSYEGDEFLLYRNLRAANPSPYLYFFDYSDFKLFGSSPEAHLVIDQGKASIFPIAGTYRRTGDDLLDQERSLELIQDPKENAEHVMLVDLARNDLNRFAKEVKVASFKEIQFFSHVIHLVSRVEGKISSSVDAIKALADTFPAGTLSGAPKRRAIELINQYEPDDRSYYGGCVGMFNLENDLNQAIIIRSILCQGGLLKYQAGAGIVIDSKPESELQEVENKIAALEKAIDLSTEQKNTES